MQYDVEDSALHGLALGMSAVICKNFGDKSVIAKLDATFERLHNVS